MISKGFAMRPDPNRPLPIEKRIWFLLKGAVENWIRHRAGSKGAALAFYTLFSMAPVLVLVIAIAGAVFGPEAARGEIYAQLKGLVGPGGADAIQMLIAGANRHEAGMVASLLAGGILLVGATSAFAELKDSLDEIWELPKSPQSGLLGLIKTRLMSFGLVLVLAFLLLVSLVVSAVLAVLERYWGILWGDTGSIFQALSSFFSFAVIAALFAVIYKFLPRMKLSWADVIVGALGTAGLFNLGKHLIGLYLGNSAVANSYGAAGSVIALLLWIYYSSQIFFLGAEFTRQFALCFGSLRHSRARSDNER